MSFLRDYLFYCKDSESDEQYHLWTAMVVLSSAIGKRVWLEQGYFRISTNIYVVLVGPPGNRKTTAMDLGKDMIKEAGEIPFSAERQSMQGLAESMTEQETAFMYKGEARSYSPMTVCATELKEFLAVSLSGMIDFLTTIYDRKYYDYKTRNKEDITIKEPYLTVIACETPEWITLRLRDDVISGGFSRRVIYVNVTRPHRRVARPTISNEQKAAWSRCVAHCKKLKEVVGEFKLSDEAGAFYDYWYENIKLPYGDITIGYHESKHILVLKVAMLVAISEMTGPVKDIRLVIEKAHIETAIEFLSETEKTLAAVFIGMGRNELNSVSAKILELLEKANGPLTEKEVFQIMFRHANYLEVVQVLQHLGNTPDIIRYSIGDSPKRAYICLRKSVPPEIQRLLARESGLTSAASASSGQPSVPLSAGTDLVDLLRGFQPVAPSQPAASSVEPQKPVG